MTVAEKIRMAALGATPTRPGIALWRWLGFGTGYHASRRCLRVFNEFWDGSETERRMFLLFVAEALESE